MKRKIYAFLLALYVFLTAGILTHKYDTKKQNNDNEIYEIISIDKPLNDIIEKIRDINIELPIFENMFDKNEETILTPTYDETTELTPKITPIITPNPTPVPTPTPSSTPSPIPTPKQLEKTIDEIALEVIGNKWGYGQDKINALTKAGYNHHEIEKRVQEIRKTNRYTIPNRNTYKYNFAYAPKQINIYDENKNVIGSLSQYQKVLISDEKIDDLVLVSFEDQIFYVYESDIRLLADSHIEVDISEQKVYLYIDGELILNADVITGYPYKGTTNGTNQGITKILLKEYDITLNENDEHHVDYFLTFNWDSEGFHDAHWRESWEYDDKERYLTHGSNGCVNMKLEDVKVLEENAYLSMPVLIHK